MGTSLSKETEDELWGRDPSSSREMERSVRKTVRKEPTLEDRLWGRDKDNDKVGESSSKSRRLQQAFGVGDEEMDVDLKDEGENPEDWDPKTAGPIFPDGEINWDCPCLGGAAHGPCGTEFRGAFGCFVKSKEDPKGADCLVQFREMQTCFSKYPELYAKDEDDDEDDDFADVEVPKKAHSGASDDEEIDEVAEGLEEEVPTEKQKPKTAGPRQAERGIKENDGPVVGSPAPAAVL